MDGEKAWQQLYKSAVSNFEQVLEATTHKTASVRPPTSHQKTIKVRRTRHTGHCWRSRDEFISDVFQCTPSHGRAKAGRPARAYIQQLCEDTGCSPEDPPEEMNDWEEWRERIRDICAGGTTRWWYFHFSLFLLNIEKYIDQECRETTANDNNNHKLHLYAKLDAVKFGDK